MRKSLGWRNKSCTSQINKACKNVLFSLSTLLLSRFLISDIHWIWNRTTTVRRTHAVQIKPKFAIVSFTVKTPDEPRLNSHWCCGRSADALIVTPPKQSRGRIFRLGRESERRQKRVVVVHRASGGAAEAGFSFTEGGKEQGGKHGWLNEMQTWRKITTEMVAEWREPRLTNQPCTERRNSLRQLSYLVRDTKPASNYSNCTDF